MVGLKSQALGYEYTGAWNGELSLFALAFVGADGPAVCTAVFSIIRQDGIRGLVRRAFYRNVSDGVLIDFRLAVPRFVAQPPQVRAVDRRLFRRL